MAMVLPTTAHRDSMAREAKLLFAIGFVYFLVAALALRVAPASWRSQMLPTSGAKGVIGEAVEAAHSFVGFAYMR